ncbi:hypothetical protein THASP1DRAFT_22618 [Thamnocephalis sphaerospora]|uniref:Uncharacterized protein n=1 Tax=Thamnocephalis sphaerospora TaxID=78915 RepID=A0A4P9XTQ4_9FUNG|nr:hypothetical protein THASP1DRAFT_22618 [Thamnocephalis sphaerospora]|eukprot:RKP09553.1 hypothetical protein THASP1DRAFT_22618 [Thamnocephalis sphaerospora]
MVTFKHFISAALIAAVATSALATPVDLQKRSPTDLVEGVKQAWKENLGPIGATTFVAAKVVHGTANALDATKEFVSNAKNDGEVAIGKAKDAGEAAVEKVKDAGEAAVDKVRDAKDAAKDVAKTVGRKTAEAATLAVGIVVYTADGLFRKTKEGLVKLGDAAHDAVHDAGKRVRYFFEPISPENIAREAREGVEYLKEVGSAGLSSLHCNVKSAWMLEVDPENREEYCVDSNHKRIGRPERVSGAQEKTFRATTSSA